MLIKTLLESSTVYYHGSPNLYHGGYDFNAKVLNRGSNVKGLYLTTNYSVAKTKYAGDGGHVYKVTVSPTNTFIHKRTSVNTELFIQSYTKALLKYTNYKKDWIETAIIPDLIDENAMKRDLSGDAKHATLVGAGYDSYSMDDMDGPVLVVLDLSIITSFDIMK